MVVLAALAAGCAGENLTPQPAGDGGAGTLACLPDLDGTLAADELPVVVGVRADYVIDTDVRVNLAGAAAAGEAARVWSFIDPAPGPGDAAVPIGPTSVDDLPDAGRFPGATFAVETAPGSGLYQMLSRDDQALWLFGIDSADGKTVLPYDQPVALLRFPLAPRDSWRETGTVSDGTTSGLPYRGTDTYDITDTATGSLAIPGVHFDQVHRVTTAVTVAPDAGGDMVTRRQSSFYSECLGEVVRATSEDGETSDDFTRAAELRRLSL